VRRREEEYLVDSVEVILDNGVTCAIPPIHNDVITAKLASGRSWTTSALKSAQTRVEKALALVEKPYPATAAGLTFVTGWGLPFFRTYLPQPLWSAKLPVDQALSSQAGSTQYAVLDAIRFPSDPAGVLLEDNHVMFKIRSDSSDILRSVEAALFDNPASGAYIGDMFDLTSKRIGFLGRGFSTTSVGKQLALAGGVPGADKIPDRAQLMLGFTSTQTAALGPDNLPSFETLPGVTNQFPSGYFAAGCAMYLPPLPRPRPLVQRLRLRPAGRPDVLPPHAGTGRPGHGHPAERSGRTQPAQHIPSRVATQDPRPSTSDGRHRAARATIRSLALTGTAAARPPTRAVQAIRTAMSSPSKISFPLHIHADSESQLGALFCRQAFGAWRWWGSGVGYCR